MATLERLDALRFGDLVTLLEVKRYASITSAARALKVSPSQVSKAITRLERYFGGKLMSRTARGVTFSELGNRVLSQSENVVERLQSLTSEVETVPQVTVAAPSYLTTFVPAIAVGLEGIRVRGIQLPAALIRAYAVENSFDFALTIGVETLPGSWASQQVGEIRSALYGATAVVKALGRLPVAAEQLAPFEFVTPVNSFNGQVIRVDDGCPLGDNRRRGHEAQTINIGLEIAARTRQLVFGPAIAAGHAVERRSVAEIPVKGWAVTAPLFVSCHERVMASLQRQVVAAVVKELAALGG